MKALFLTGSNQYGVVTHFLHGMMSDLKLLGIRVHELNVASQTTRKKTELNLDPLLTYDFILSFNGVGLDVVIDGMSISACTKTCKVFVFLVDHPLHLITRFIGLDVTVLCVDKEHVAFCELCNIKAIYFPHAVSESDLTSHTPVNYSEKNNEIIYPVSFLNVDVAKKRLQPVWHQIGPLVEQSSNMTRFLQYLSVLPLGDKPSSVALDENIRRIAVLTDFYLRAKARKEFLLKCQESRIVLTVIGNNSENYRTEFSAHNYESAIPFSALLTRIHEARFVAHNSPGFELGLHERVVIPLALGTHVLADAPYIQNTFGKAVTSTHGEPINGAELYKQSISEARTHIWQNHTWRQQWIPLVASV
ncbi:hypothetical protein [Paraglaciecola sp. 20A4]|uniref:hypothetical protein n=1 Tax=Paraglaciecola sp. 20A4 TaxID=2687288 RepID=UPI001409EC40|nr:hypothetical protein [Paraglaciecola sp. 20A4]